MNIIFYTTVCIFNMVLSPFNTISCLFACFYVTFVLMFYCLLCLVLFLIMINYHQYTFYLTMFHIQMPLEGCHGLMKYVCVCVCVRACMRACVCVCQNFNLGHSEYRARIQLTQL